MDEWWWGECEKHHLPLLITLLLENIKTSHDVLRSHQLLFSAHKYAKLYILISPSDHCRVVRKQIRDKWKIGPDVRNVYELFMNQDRLLRSIQQIWQRGWKLMRCSNFWDRGQNRIYCSVERQNQEWEKNILICCFFSSYLCKPYIDVDAVVTQTVNPISPLLIS